MMMILVEPTTMIIDGSLGMGVTLMTSNAETGATIGIVQP